MARYAVSPVDGLTDRQRLAVRLLAQGRTIREVARSLNVSEKTIWNYRQQPAVQKAIVQQQTQLIEEGGGQSVTSIPQAMTCLQQILNDPEARDSDRIAASKAILGAANSFGERQLLERKLRDLEEALRSYGTEDATVITTVEALDPLLPSANPEDGDE